MADSGHNNQHANEEGLSANLVRKLALQSRVESFPTRPRAPALMCVRRARPRRPRCP